MGRSKIKENWMMLKIPIQYCVRGRCMWGFIKNLLATINHTFAT